MQQRQLITLLFLALAAAVVAVLVVAVYSSVPAADAVHGNRLAVAMLGGLAVLLLMAAAWWLVDRLTLRPARKLNRGIRALLESRSADQDLPIPAHHALGGLPASVEALADALRHSRRETSKAMQSATAKVDEQKAWLEVILQGLSEGVLVCNRQHQILLYNKAALATLNLPDTIGLGRPLFNILTSAPVKHTLERLELRHLDDSGSPPELTAPFVCSSADSRQMLHGRMALILDLKGAVSGYLITLSDISEDVSLLARGDALRRVLTRDLRSMTGNLRAAAETLAAYPDMEPAERQSFDQVILNESKALSHSLDDLSQELRGDILGRWPMADIFIPDLINCLQHHIEDLPDVRITLVGIPLWLHGDSLSLMLALECLLRRLRKATGARSFDLEGMLGDRRVYLDIIWDGDPIAPSEIENWLELSCGERMGEHLGRQRLRDVLERHDCEPWSQAGRGPGQALLRLPLLAPLRTQFLPEPARLPARPEFYDFGLMQEHAGSDELAGVMLRDLSFVVFDCEMTGLDPVGGDEIISIAGVRVVKHRVLTGETFERLVNPGRAIPPSSIRFHGITDEQVQNKPSIQVVLPQFKAFVDEAVLVAHNAAFDMKFLSLKQDECGVRFDNPVLDTLLLSSMLEGDEEDHSLDALCQRYGIPISGRHTALGDALATAELLRQLIHRLEAQGIHSFGEVMKASNMAAQLRQRSVVVSHQASS